MSRLLLLGFNDSDVDVLTHIPGLDPKPEVMVIHPDPAALIVKLADLAGLSTSTTPPEPRDGDVVVTPANGKGLGGLIEPWAKMGARILSPEDLVPPVKPPSTSSPKEHAMNLKTISEKTASAPRTTTQVTPWRSPEVGHDAPPAEVWTRPELSQRDRRLLCIGAIAALGERDTFAIQVRSALKNGELTAEQVRELLIHLAPYAGYPRVAGLVGEVERLVAEHAS